MTPFSNTRTVRIDWGDCDPAGIIFYPRYFEIFDASAAHLFEAALGITKFEMFKTYWSSQASRWCARMRRFLKPTRFGDDVIVESKFVFGRSSFDIEHKLRLKGDVCAECSETRVWVHARRRMAASSRIRYRKRCWRNSAPEKPAHRYSISAAILFRIWTKALAIARTDDAIEIALVAAGATRSTVAVSSFRTA